MNDNARLILTEGYNFNFDQATNLLLHIYENPGVRHSRKSLSVELCISDRMVKCITNYCKATGLLKSGGFKLSPLGELVLRYDPYFGKIGTLWVLHYMAASQRKYIIWNKIFNDLIYELPSISALSSFVSNFDFLEGRFTPNTIKKNVPSEVSTILNAYTVQQFRKLGLISILDTDFVISKNQPIDDLIFLALIKAFHEQYYSGATTFDIVFIYEEKNSPGRICNFSLPNIRSKLENLHGQKLIQLETRADLDQIRFTLHHTFLDILELYYEEYL